MSPGMSGRGGGGGSAAESKATAKAPSYVSAESRELLPSAKCVIAVQLSVIELCNDTRFIQYQKRCCVSLGYCSFEQAPGMSPGFSNSAIVGLTSFGLPILHYLHLC